ncbi:cytochrome P450 [Coniophora puteana RWD-64-598 SS2]|uniref:Cytochrome P450 n=1 Tax=Coniophora puteana (strain RWD-64-598) TaxID=741705 RepID=A0A5M3MXW3_CONPW|nr:cytochrome P450 [Coniophora puteana RWD-64-598 SS2]EIW83950.1 cytochrome P450 [Coniophora puteana RWD-64-598 SS2]
MDNATLRVALMGVGSAATVLVGLALVKQLLARRYTSAGPSLPPGPPPLPIVGNALEVPSDEAWLTYTKWQKQYGDIVYCRLLGTDVVVLNSEKVAEVLLERRSRIYSSRPHLATRVPFGWGFHFVFEEYGDKWRTNRRLFHQSFREEMTMHYHPFLQRSSHQLLLNLRRDPARLFEYLSLFANSAMLSSIYGYETNDVHDPFVRNGEKAFATLDVITPEKSVLLELFPFILDLPDWFPGIALQRHARAARRVIHDYIEKPFQFTMKNLQAEASFPSMLSDSIRRFAHRQDEFSENMMKEVSAAAFTGGAETTSSTLLVLVLAMVLHPDVQRRAQEEIAATIGSVRLPALEDRPALPYIDAVIREVMRWQPVVPLAVPHATVENDVYDNYFIPKGSTVILNTWAISRNPEKYPNPETFDPGRFLDADGQLTEDGVKWNFGYGRRICPGRHLAEAGVWISAACLLATFSFLKAKDESGRDVEFEPKWTTGLNHAPWYRSLAALYQGKARSCTEP